MWRSCFTRLLPFVALLTLFAGRVSAHPSSGIVVDENGNVFVADINTGLWKIDTDGKLTHIYKEAGHWLALDAEGSFARVDFTKSDHWPRWFKRRTPDGAKPALITDGGSPLVVHRDGNLYYVSGGAKLNPGGHEVIRLTPDGKLKSLAPELGKIAEKLGGIKGLAPGPDGSLYVTFPKAVHKITTDGKVTAVAESVQVADGDKDVVEGFPKEELPYLRGLAVDTRGTVYAAATGCRRVVKITPDGKVETVLKAERPWSPTGIAVQGEAIYVLEYPNQDDDHRADWVPRVRKVGRDGKVTTLVTFSKKDG
jgi:SMP-30/Gluconolactonase/LRE-like region